MKKVIRIFLLITSYSIIFYFVNNYDCGNPKSFPTILTLLSILTGFTMTALSIIATSNFSQTLYNIESKTNNSLTLLHDLVSEFKYATIFFTVNILTILIYEFNGLEFSNSLDNTFITLIWLLTFISFFVFLKLFYLFVSFILKSVANSNLKN